MSAGTWDIDPDPAFAVAEALRELAAEHGLDEVVAAARGWVDEAEDDPETQRLEPVGFVPPPGERPW